ncbi:Outer membrane protein C precursor [Marinomonas spartinae]|uniref:Outer membrane protein C n=1 Tax=Marinomonas spartinae TaxID=1792290 RepID=A0A1A8TQP9_9GAMM|nr:porin [Marinomonas spartinae]SBS36724.1 Outer membrane protein C precursor [Marinomonas spartinae]
MKKAIFTLATPLLLAATAANAASIIKTDNSSLDIFGRAKFTAKNDSVKGSSAGLSSRFGVKGEIKDENGNSAFFRTGWNMASSTDSSASNNTKTTSVADPDKPTDKNKRNNVLTSSGGNNISARYQFVGLGFEGIGKFTFGQNDTPFYTLVTSATDIFQYGGLEASAGTYGYNFAPNQALYSNTFGRLTVQASYQFKTTEGGDSKNGDILDVFSAGLTSANFKTQNNAYSAAASYALTDALNLRAGYAFQTFTNKATKSNYGLAADYTVGNLYFAGVYTHNKEDDGQNKASRNGYEVAASYNMDKYTFTTGYAYGTQDSDVATTPNPNGGKPTQNDDIAYAKAFKLGVTYHVFSNVKTIAQITHNTSGSNTYLGGLNYTF